MPLGTDPSFGEWQFRGLIQPRAEYERRSADEDSFDGRFRRAWLDLRGEIHDPNLYFRFQIDVSGSASARDIWMEYRPGPVWRFRLGQYTVPFARSRAVGGPNRTFTEISIAANEFQVPQGRDTGAGVFGTDPGGRWAISAHLMDGRGRLDRRDDDRPSSRGALASARGDYALLGRVPSHTATLGERAERPALTVGAGLVGANRNVLRDWSLGAEATAEEQEADWGAATVDITSRTGPFALTLAGYQRRVALGSGPRYWDHGYEAEIAAALPCVTQELAVRRATLRRDVDGDLSDNVDEAGQQREWSAGWTAYHDGHRRKTQLFILRTRGAGHHDDWAAHAQHQIRF